MTNGYRIYNIGNSNGTIKYQMDVDDGTIVPFKVTDAQGKLVGGDSNGNISLKVVSDGVWFCQNRTGNYTGSNKPDNRENVALMFYNHDGDRAFQSYTATLTDGSSLSQTSTSIMQSTPGAGLAVSADEKYLYVVNHDGNIVEFLIGGTTAKKTLSHTRTFVTTYGAISSLNFDYAGNLVATTFATYPSYESQIVVYTLPYLGKENARSIPAPKSCRTLPERLSHLEMGSPALELFIQNHPSGCAVDLDRPLQGNMFNTICLPFEVALNELPETHPLYDATLKEFTGISLENINGENSLSLIFSDVQDGIILANEPYLIQPKEDINNIMHFSQTITMSSIEGNIKNRTDGKGNSVDFVGVVPYKLVEPKYAEDGVTPLTLLLVANNRLAALTSPSNMLGFRAYFQLEKPLPTGTQTRISTRRPTPTNNTIVVDGKKVNVDKYLREGRVYIRIDDQVYDLTGARVH